MENLEGSIPGLVCVTVDIYLEEGENRLVFFMTLLMCQIM
jgi:hypothetical protein